MCESVCLRPMLLPRLLFLGWAGTTDQNCLKMASPRSSACFSSFSSCSCLLRGSTQTWSLVSAFAATSVHPSPSIAVMIPVAGKIKIAHQNHVGGPEFIPERHLLSIHSFHHTSHCRSCMEKSIKAHVEPAGPPSRTVLSEQLTTWYAFKSTRSTRLETASTQHDRLMWIRYLRLRTPSHQHSHSVCPRYEGLVYSSSHGQYQNNDQPRTESPHTTSASCTWECHSHASITTSLRNAKAARRREAAHAIASASPVSSPQLKLPRARKSRADQAGPSEER